MSGFKEVATVFNNQQQIIEALELACPEFKGKIEVGVQGQNKIALRGHGVGQVDIAIRSSAMEGQAAENGYADMGLKFNGRTYDWVISDCDQGNYEKQTDGTPNQQGHYNSQYGKYGPAFQEEVASAYNAVGGLKKVKSVGWQAVGTLQPMTDKGQDCWGVEVEIDEDVLARMGVRIPAK
jgi:hypothetical protein